MWFQETAITITAAAIAIEKEVTSLFYSDYCYSTSSVTSWSTSSSTHHGYSVWVWMTIIVIGFYTATSIYANAVACYQFLAAWSLISRTNRFDVELLHNHKRTFAERRDRMQRALHTQSYAEQLVSSSSMDGNHREHHCHPRPADTNERIDSCPICLMDFQVYDRVSSSKDIQRCQHVFHEECLISWLDKHQSCPCCRFDILP